MCSSSAKIYRRSTSIQLTKFSTKLLWQIFVSNAISPPGSELWIDRYGPVQIDRYSSNHLSLDNGNAQYFLNYTGNVTLFGKCSAQRRHIIQYRDGPLQLYENGWFILKNSVAPPGTSVPLRALYCYRVLLHIVHAFIWPPYMIAR